MFDTICGIIVGCDVWAGDRRQESGARSQESGVRVRSQESGVRREMMSLRSGDRLSLNETKANSAPEFLDSGS